MAESSLHGILNTCLYPLQLGNTAQDTLQEFIDIDVTADDLVRILNNNHAYRDIFARFVTAKRGKPATKEEEQEKRSPTHRMINLLGMIGSRNFIVALRMHKAVTGHFPDFEDKKSPFSSPDMLKRALEIEELFARNKYAYSETVYAAGVLFDWLFYIASKSKNAKKLEPYFQETWKRTCRYALMAHCLAERAPNFGFHKFAAAGAMLTQAGKLQMALAYPGGGGPSWIDFEEKIPETKFPNIARLTRERSTFAYSQEEFSGMNLYFFTVFKPLEPAVRFYREPYFLKSTDPTSYKFAMFLELVDTFARKWTLPKDEKDPIIEAAVRPWNKDLAIPKKVWLDALRAAMSAR